MNLYRAVVEDNLDPLKAGRVKVRIFGIHTENNENSAEEFIIKTSDLPWAEVMGSTELGLVSGIGMSSIPKQGSWVWVIFELEDKNKPIVIGTCTGIATDSSKYTDGMGFNDPAEQYPKQDRLSEPDINEVTRGEINNTIINTKNSNLDSSSVYSETAQAKSTYPLNKVIESESGHMIELDDTTGNERIQIIDSVGNYSEMKLTEYIDKAVQDKVNLVMGNLLEHIAGNTEIKSDGNVTWTIGGNLTIQVTGAIDIDGARIDLN